ncbi:HpcH/HpaI aldolase family protein [Hydrogenophaga sp. BPS33]|uniref:HpcH/HpaI aldolase family protein n=1 Tax=Hydrogenophaga sp. BPS33 TaxID=2651974 RepID=UPI00131F852B|nr:aldolase/citrate lyase family protein [Hydrogenophaga sp. BPS33]QHE85054.1 hypothetical protein F9K07_09245 [Hydrogenophaga sp. BPS33]
MRKRLKDRLDRQRPALGTNVFSSDPAVVEILALSGWDFAKVDMEHTTLSIGDVVNHVRAGHAMGIPVVARVPWNDRSAISRLMDAGVAGIQLPHFAEDADASIEAALTLRYPPAGVRPTCTGTRAAHYGRADFAAYANTADRDALCIALVEDVESLAHLEDALDKGRVDAVQAGPADLATSLGRPGDLQHPEVLAAVESIMAIGRRKGIATGVYVKGSTDLARWRRFEPEFVICSIDYRVLGNAYSALAAELLDGAVQDAHGEAR